MQQRYKLTIAYDGTDYVGWQIQKNGISIQAKLAAALQHITGQEIRPIGAGRTDAGVHAVGQVAHAALRWRHSAADLMKALNSHLPEDIRVRTVERVDPHFHAQKGATQKWYRYVIYEGSESLLFERRYAWHVGRSLKVSVMWAGAKILKGRHDFASFQGSGASVKTTVRNLSRITIRRSRYLTWPGRDEGSWLLFDFYGEGFLKQMVRNIVGTLVEVGRGEISPTQVKSVLQVRDRKKAGICAPPHGLYLMQVDYASGNSSSS